MICQARRRRCGWSRRRDAPWGLGRRGGALGFGGVGAELVVAPVLAALGWSSAQIEGRLRAALNLDLAVADLPFGCFLVKGAKCLVCRCCYLPGFLNINDLDFRGGVALVLSRRYLSHSAIRRVSGSSWDGLLTYSASLLVFIRMI